MDRRLRPPPLLLGRALEGTLIAQSEGAWFRLDASGPATFELYSAGMDQAVGSLLDAPARVLGSCEYPPGTLQGDDAGPFVATPGSAPSSGLEAASDSAKPVFAPRRHRETSCSRTRARS